MAVTVLTQAKVLLGAVDLSAYAHKVTFGPMSVATKDVTNFASGGYVLWAAGLKSTPFTVSGFQDLSATGPDTAFALSVLGQQNLATFATPGATVGDPAYFTHGIVSQYTPGGAQVGDVNPLSLNMMSDVQFVGGVVTAPSTTLATIATTNGTSTTLAGPTAGHTLYAGIHVTSFSGTTSPTVTFKIQSAPASNFASPTDRITVWTGTAAGAMNTTGWQWGSVAGAVTDGFWRVVATTTGATISTTFLAVIGIL